MIWGDYLNSHGQALTNWSIGWQVKWYGWRSDYPCYSAMFRCCE
jgi:hypothetical protein